MADFIAADLHKKVDALMDRFYGAGVASHPTIIEQINYLLFMRALSFKDDEYRQLGVTDPDKIVFDGELEKYRWENLLSLNAEALFTALEDCFRKIPESTTNKTVRLVFRNAHIKLYDKPSLRVVLHEIDAFAKVMDEGEHEGKRDIFGDTYEYLLSKLAQAGTSGQFRTPRHIIEFLVAVVAPQKGETILDPAVGTAGFLVKAFEFMRSIYTSPEVLATGGSFDKLSAKELSVLYEHTFSGFDSDEDMIKFGMMNLYLHGLENAHLIRQNTLTDTAGNRDKYDVILANPPFSGKIDRDSVAQELQMNTGATEVLFLRYMLEHLSDHGRIGAIVPEGVVFNSSGAHTKIRKMLIDDGLWCVVSLPAGVFQPYSGVRTSVVFIDKEIAKKFNHVMFINIGIDGFDLTTNRRPIIQNDLPNALVLINECKKQINSGQVRPEMYFPFEDPEHVISVAPLSYSFETVDRINEESDNTLQSSRYKTSEVRENQKWPMVALEEVVEINPQKSELKELGDNYEVSFAPMADLKEETSEFIPSEVRKLGQVRAGYTYFRDGDVLLAKVTPCFENGKAGIANVLKNGIGFGSSEYYVFRTSDKILPEFLYRLIKDESFRSVGKLSMTGTGGLQRLPKSFVSNYKIPLPPIEVQQKIVAEIENKQKAINHARSIIETLERERAYFDPSARAQKESWPIVKLGDVTKLVRGPFGGSLKKEIFEPNGYKVYEQNDAIHGNLEATRYFINESKFNEMKRFQVHPNDLIMSCSGTLGRVSYIPEGSPLGVINQALLKITPSPEILPMFLKHILESSLMQRLFLLNSQGGVIQNVVSVKQLSQLEFPLPSPEEQQKIVAEFAEEEEMSATNKKFIDIYEDKIHQTLAEIWGQ